jgi:uncharacterized membrane protein (UPF0127 family)
MKDMKFSIDIIWLDKDLQVVYFEENVSPDTYPNVFKPDKKAKYILEVNAHFVSKNHIKYGDQLSIF